MKRCVTILIMYIYGIVENWRLIIIDMMFVNNILTRDMVMGL